MVKIEINTEFITLGQFLKLSGTINTGGEAKIYLLSNIVFVNDEPENRRGKKLRQNDVVKIDSKSYLIVNKIEN